MKLTLPVLVLGFSLPSAAIAQPYSLTASSLACGGATTPVAAGSYALAFVIGDPLAASTGSAGPYSLSTGFLATAAGGTLCYPNCDGSAGSPLLTANDFQCFLNEFAAGHSYANCDGSSVIPVLTANDFQCFLNRYAGGCS